MRIIECYYCGSRTALPNHQVEEMENAWVEGGKAYSEIKFSCPDCKDKKELPTITLRKPTLENEDVWDDLYIMSKGFVKLFSPYVLKGDWKTLIEKTKLLDINLSVDIIGEELFLSFYFRMDGIGFGSYPVFSDNENTTSSSTQEIK